MTPKLFPAKIKTERLIIRKHTEKDALPMFNLLNSDRRRLGKFLHFVPMMKSVRDQKKFIVTSRRDWSRKSRFSYGIFRAEDGVMMGNIGIHTIRWPHDSMELGYWIAGDFEGHGYISEAVMALAQTGFKMGFHRVEIHCDPENIRSGKVALRCGFRREGVLFGQRKIGGRYRDTEVFALLASNKPLKKGKSNK